MQKRQSILTPSFFKFSEATPFFITCKDHEEVDYCWDNLTASSGQGGYVRLVKDPFGVSWQVVPSFISNKMSQGDPERTGKMMQALGGMKS